MTNTDINVEQWKIKQLVKRLGEARGNGTSMISLIIPPKDQIARVQKMLTEEYGTASNIKSRVNRLSVLSAITSTQQRLKLYTKVPENGLVLYCGTIVTDEGKEKKVNIDFEPFKPINTSLYLCHNRFNTDPLAELFKNDDTFGFIVMDGNGCLFATVTGNNQHVLHKFDVDLPKKHRRGGQSSARFGRIRVEKRQNYVTKVAEMASKMFIGVNNKPSITGLILAGSADFKNELSGATGFDPRLQAIIISTVDVSYGGESGFNEAIDLSSDVLTNVKLVQEKKVISTFFEALAKDTGKYSLGVNETLKALEMGAVETLIVWEDLSIQRHVLKNTATGEESVFVTTDDLVVGEHMEVIDVMPLVEYLANNYSKFGATISFVSNKSTEGSQFCHGFGGIVGLLRYVVNFVEMDEYEADNDESDEFDFI